MKDNLTYMDLFCGAGGFSIGFGDQNFELLLANDIWGKALNTFRSNLKTSHPNTPLHYVVEESITDLYLHLGGGAVTEKHLGSKSVIPQKELKQRKDSEKQIGQNQSYFYKNKVCEQFVITFHNQQFLILVFSLIIIK